MPRASKAVLAGPNLSRISRTSRVRGIDQYMIDTADYMLVSLQLSRFDPRTYASNALQKSLRCQIRN